jgi:hypothetical protein
MAELETNKSMLVSKMQCLTTEVKAISRDLTNVEGYK